MLLLRRVPPDLTFAFFARQHLHSQVHQQSSKATKVDDVHTAEENAVVNNTDSSLFSKIDDMKCFFSDIIPAICYVTPMLLQLLLPSIILLIHVQDFFVNDNKDGANAINMCNHPQAFQATPFTSTTLSAGAASFEVRGAILAAIDTAVWFINRGENAVPRTLSTLRLQSIEVVCLLQLLIRLHVVKSYPSQLHPTHGLRLSIVTSLGSTTRHILLSHLRTTRVTSMALSIMNTCHFFAIMKRLNTITFQTQNDKE